MLPETAKLTVPPEPDNVECDVVLVEDVPAWPIAPKVALASFMPRLICEVPTVA